MGYTVVHISKRKLLINMKLTLKYPRFLPAFTLVCLIASSATAVAGS